MKNDLKIGIVQPQFFPWPGQFSLMSKCNKLIILDNVQWVKRHWYNRNYINSNNGPVWINVPVNAPSHRQLMINDIKIDQSQTWQKTLLSRIEHNYRKAPFFHEYYQKIADLINLPWVKVADLSVAALIFITDLLSIDLRIHRASQLSISSTEPVQRLIEICKLFGATSYLSGPAAKNYIKCDKPFSESGIKLEWMRYPEYKYNCIHKSRDVNMSVLDLLFHEGKNSRLFL